MDVVNDMIPLFVSRAARIPAPYKRAPLTFSSYNVNGIEDETDRDLARRFVYALLLNLEQVPDIMTFQEVTVLYWTILNLLLRDFYTLAKQDTHMPYFTVIAMRKSLRFCALSKGSQNFKKSQMGRGLQWISMLVSTDEIRSTENPYPFKPEKNKKNDIASRDTSPSDSSCIFESEQDSIAFLRNARMKRFNKHEDQPKRGRFASSPPRVLPGTSIPWPSKSKTENICKKGEQNITNSSSFITLDNLPTIEEMTAKLSKEAKDDIELLNFDKKSEKVKILVVTSHLESMADNGKVRSSQIEEFEALQLKFPDHIIIFGGDLNARDQCVGKAIARITKPWPLNDIAESWVKQTGANLKSLWTFSRGDLGFPGGPYKTRFDRFYMRSDEEKNYLVSITNFKVVSKTVPEGYKHYSDHRLVIISFDLKNKQIKNDVMLI